MMSLNQFDRQQYLNIETFRKSGVGVKTPVWFVQDGDTIYVRTVADSGKVKRIRNNGHVNIAPCKSDGRPVGIWVPAMAREIRDEAFDRKVDRLLDKKYGLMKKMFGLASTLQKRQSTVLELRLGE
jgi:PPOX class probable F420-dependent enzyme